jgi:hypothetical protein
MRRALVGVVAVSVAIPVVTVLPDRPARAVTTHTFTGTDPDAPTDWTSAQNWNTQQVPEDGDIVVIEGKRVTNVPGDKSFLGVTIRNGAHLDSGGPLTTFTFTSGCARSDVSIDVTSPTAVNVFGLDLSEEAILTNFGNLAVWAAPPPASDLCTTDTAGHRGKLRLHPGSQLRNRGILRGDGTVLGMNCCLAPQQLRNLASGTIEGTEGTGLIVRNLRLWHAGTIRGGTVTVEGGFLRLTSTSRFDGATTPLTVEVVDGAVVEANETDPSNPGFTVPSTISLGMRATLAVYDGDLIGRGDWGGAGTLALRGGSIQGQQRLSNSTHLSVSGPDPKSIRRFGAGDPADVVIASGPVTFGTGPLTLGGRVRLEPDSDLTVPAGSRPVVTGLTCCTSPFVLRNRGRIVVGPGGELRLRNLQLSNAGRLGGSGKVVLDGGPSTFTGGATVSGNVTLTRGATLTISGTTTLTGTVDQEDAAVTGQIGTSATVAGTGTWVMLGGSLNGALSFGDDLRFETAGPAMKSVTTSPTPGTSTAIIVAGPALLGGTGPLRLTGSAGVAVAFGGTTNLVGAQIDASSCCTSPARLRFDGPVQVRANAGVSRIRNLRVSFWERVDLNGGQLEVNPAAMTLGNVSTTRVALEGGQLTVATVDLVVPPAVQLIGPGVVEVRTLRLNGRARNATRGPLTVDGSLVMGSGAQLLVGFTSTGRDRVTVTGLAQLDGTLQLSGAGTLPRGYRLLTADERLGRFSGLVNVPAGRSIVYGANFVALG